MTVINPTYMKKVAEKAAQLAELPRPALAGEIADLMHAVADWKQYHYVAMKALFIACEGLRRPDEGFKAALEQAEAGAAND